MSQRNAALVSGNALKLGLFGANCSSGRTYATIPEPVGGKLGEQPSAWRRRRTSLASSA